MHDAIESDFDMQSFLFDQSEMTADNANEHGPVSKSFDQNMCSTPDSKLRVKQTSSILPQI